MISFLIFCFIPTFGCEGETHCTFKDNADFDNGYFVQLYNVQSAEDCCQACGNFEECTNFAWIKNPAAGTPWYQSCYLKADGRNPKLNIDTTCGVNDAPKPSYQCASKEDNIDTDSAYLSMLQQVPSADRCCQLCSTYPGCNYWTWVKDPSAGEWYQNCFLKAGVIGAKVANPSTVSGACISTPLASPRAGKRGLGWFNSQSCSDIKLMSNVSWLYNWSPTPDEAVAGCMSELGIEFVPMIWGKFDNLDDVSSKIYGNSKFILAFNEPNFFSQSNVTPAEAAAMWPAITTFANARGLKIGSPAPAPCGPATDCYMGNWDPTLWMDHFLGNCTGCQIDFLATHVYDCSMSFFTSYLDGWKKYNKPVWLTEFACPAASDQTYEWNMDFMNHTLQYLESEPFIQRYAWFGTRVSPYDGWLGPQVNLLYTNQSGLTPLGVFYNTFN